MKEFAHISWRGGSVWLPTDTPYARELLVDYVRSEAQSHDRIRLQMNRHECFLSGGPYTALQCVCSTPTRCWMSAGLARRMGCTGRRSL
jgi:hypothetical protein